MTKKRAMHRGKGREATSGLDTAAILKLFKERGKPLSYKEIIRGLRLPGQKTRELDAALRQLLDAGKIIALQGAYGLTENMSLLTGVLEVQRSGVGFVIPDDQRRGDIFVSPRDFGEAWHGDRVAVALTPGRAGKRRQEGRIARVVERGIKRPPCRVLRRAGEGVFICRPADPRITATFMAEAGPGQADLATGDIVILEPGDRLDHQVYAATVAERMGAEEDVAVQERLVKLNHNIPGEFPRGVLAEAEALPADPGPGDFAGRKDLRELPLVTIDGAKARDFDDAVHVAKTRSGFTLTVAIADVAHYVRPGSRLDKEAAARANSYYFPASVEPMLPPALSDGLCSLKPDVPRLAMVAEMAFSAKGAPGRTSFYPAVIQSAARLTYSQVNRAVILSEAEEAAKIKDHVPMLKQAEKLARVLNERRRERGSLDFDLPEPEILLNLSGETVDIRPRPRNFAHQIIEEFMLAANEAVAAFLTEQGHPPLYRVHPEPDPDKLKALFTMLSRTDLAAHLPDEPTAGGLQKLLAAAQGTDLDFLVSRLTLRTMMQASYSPDLVGHFGLASPCYCHFTSPIRRYADLTVHRALAAALTAPGPGKPAKGARKLAESISAQERIGMEAEREIVKRLTVLFLRDKAGQEFSGVISSLADFGFWVELSEVMAEGLVRLSSLTDDYYAYLPERQEIVGSRTARRLTLGQSVRVVLTDVSVSRLEVNLSLVDQALRKTSGAREKSAQPRDGKEHKGGRTARGKKRSARTRAR